LKLASITRKRKESRVTKSDEGPVAACCRTDWIDQFIDNVRPYIFVREEDDLLIKVPNQAFRLNSSGVRVLRFLLDGGTIGQLLEQCGAGREEDIALFMYEVKRCLEGSLSEHDHSRAVEVKPLELNFSRLPVLSEIAVTSRCNLRCVFCYAGCACRAGEPGADMREMSCDEVMAVIDTIHGEARVPSLSFTGGEPLLRRDLTRLVAHASARGMRVNLITNGTLLTGKLARELAAAGLDSAQVSLEGSSAGIHEAVTGIAHSFDRTVSAVGMLREEGIHVHTNTTINRLNMDECVELPAFIDDTLGLAKFSMNMVIPSGSATVNADQLVRYSEVGVLLEAIIAASRKRGIEFMWYSPTPLCVFNPIIHGLGNKGCSACDGLLSVDSTGDILPCSSWDEPVGNLLSGSFTDIWASGRAESLRLKSEAHPHCRECDSFAVCHGACPLYWRHFGFDELCRRQNIGNIAQRESCGVGADVGERHLVDGEASV
jgi:radical SAM protein with 4Fe4S-binding SPASM domain